MMYITSCKFSVHTYGAKCLPNRVRPPSSPVIMISFVRVVRTFKVYFLSNFGIYSAVLLTFFPALLGPQNLALKFPGVCPWATCPAPPPTMPRTRPRVSRGSKSPAHSRGSWPLDTWASWSPRPMECLINQGPQSGFMH